MINEELIKKMTEFNNGDSKRIYAKEALAFICL